MFGITRMLFYTICKYFEFQDSNIVTWIGDIRVIHYWPALCAVRVVTTCEHEMKKRVFSHYA